MFIDTHAHLDLPEFRNESSIIIGRAKTAGVQKIINIGKFESCIVPGCQFEKETIVFGSNTKGKSTLTAIFRSLQTGNSDILTGRKTFGVTGDKKVEIDFDDNGAIVNNIKHLRGATMRMLRGTSGAPQFNILKSYSLYLLSPNSPELVKEAIEELKIGINNWSELEPDTFNFEKFFFRFKKNIKRHIGEIPNEFFGDVDDDYYTTKNLNWLKKFNSKFLKNYNNAITTSN